MIFQIQILAKYFARRGDQSGLWSFQPFAPWLKASTSGGEISRATPAAQTAFQEGLGIIQGVSKRALQI